MSLNPQNPAKRITVATTALSLNTSGIVTVSAPLRLPRVAFATFATTANALIGGPVDHNVAPGAGGSSGNPFSVVVLQVSGIKADVQFLVTNYSGLLSGVYPGLSNPSPAQSGVGFSGGTLLVSFEGD